MDDFMLSYFKRQVEMERDRLTKNSLSSDEEESEPKEPIQTFLQTLLHSLDEMEGKLQRLSECGVQPSVQDVENDVTAMKEKIVEAMPALIGYSREMRMETPEADIQLPMMMINEKKAMEKQKIETIDLNFPWPISDSKTFNALTKKVQESPIYAECLTTYFQRPAIGRKLKAFFTWNILKGVHIRKWREKVAFEDSPVMKLIACAWAEVDQMSTKRIYKAWHMQLLRMGAAENSRRYREKFQSKIENMEMQR